ncbi:MAG: hypothetical protein HC915_03440 [Anaerolineae bacterium]|nr:hypothetical protein [Anaerolineae bacterium]
MAVGISPKEQLIQALQEALAKLKARMKENEASLVQNNNEVNQLQQRNVTISAQLTRVLDNFETIPRQDIKVAYEDSIEVQKRLANFRGNLERFQATQHLLTEFYETLEVVLENLEGVQIDSLGPGGGGAPLAPTLSLAGEQIVRIVEAQESERRRLANSLHDGPAQSLSNFILQAEIVQRLFNRDPDRASTELESLKQAASISFHKVREFIFDLRPMMLDDLGLVATSRRHVENLSGKEDLKADFFLTGTDRRLPRYVEVIAYRGLQLLISNARDLMQAKKVKVVLHVGENNVIVSVESDGQGFDPAIALDRDQGDSPFQNLLDLQQRVELINGRLEIHSGEEADTTKIEIHIPYSDDEME